MRDLGVMVLDEEGRWIDLPLEEILDMEGYVQNELPPEIPTEWWQYADPIEESLPPQTDTSGQMDVAIDPRQPQQPSSSDLP